MTSFLERLTDLEAKVGDAPWFVDGYGEHDGTRCYHIADVVKWNVYRNVLDFGPDKGTADFVAFLRNAVPEVKALIEAAQENLDCEHPRAAFDEPFNDRDPKVYLGDVPCDACPPCRRRMALDALNRLEVN